MAESSADVTFAGIWRSLADKYLKDNSPGKAFLHYLLALQLRPEWKNELKTSFSTALCDWGKFLEHEERFDHLFSSYERALEVYPDNEVILNNLGAHLCRLQHPVDALNYFNKALQVNGDYLPAYRNVQVTKNLLVERWHFRMLNDTIRNRSFQKAILKKISEGHERVLDIGTGTGILSIYAKQGGAKQVYGCDYSETMISIAEKVLGANFMLDSIELINKLSNELSIPEDIPERVSLAVTETFDGGLLGEHILETLIHAWEHLLLPGTNEHGDCIERVIPRGAFLYITPIECLQIARKNFIIKSNRIERESFKRGLDLSDVTFFSALDEPYDTENLKQMDYSCLAPPQKLFSFNFNDVLELKRYYSGEISKSLQIELISEGFIDSFAVWFEMILDHDTVITSSPLSDNRCCWEQAIFSQKEEWIVKKNSIVSLNSVCKKGILSLEPERTASLLDEKEKNSVPQSVISFLNCESLLLTFIKLADRIKDLYDGQIAVLDISCCPYLSILLAQHFDCDIAFTNPNIEIVSASNKILVSLKKNIKITSLSWSEMILLSEDKNRRFNLIFLDILDNTGQINEEVIVMLPNLRNLLAPGGLLFPSKLCIWCKLVSSDELLTSSQMNSLKNELQIAEFINEYKVSHMIDVNIHETEYQELSSSFIIGYLDLMNLSDTTVSLEKTEAISRSGCINSLLYWFSYVFFDGVEFSTYSEDSYINHAAVLLDTPLQALLDSYLCEFAWRRRYEKEDLFHKILHSMFEYWPPSA